MSQKNNAEEYLVEHYTALENLRSDFRNDNLYQLVTSLVEGNTVVDIGCGMAFLLRSIKEQGKIVYGIETSSGMRHLAKKFNPEIMVYEGAAEDVIPIIKDPVQTILMIDVLEHVKDDNEQVKKIWSVLAPHGQFIIVVPAHSFLYGERDRAMGHYRRYSKKSVTEVLERNNFKIESLRFWNMLGFLPYLFYEKIMKKPLTTSLRKKNNGKFFAGILQSLLHKWFSIVENNFNFRFGLSIIVVARKKTLIIWLQ